MSLSADIRRAFETGEPDAPNRKATVINYDIDPRSVPKPFDLTPVEQDQLARLQKHIRIVAKHDAFDQSKEGSLAAIVNKCSPNVRAAIAASREFVERFDQTSGRMMPFDDRKELPKPDAIDQRIIDRDRHEQIVGGIHERLNTREAVERVNDSPPTMRDAIEVAFTTTEPEGADHG